MVAPALVEMKRVSASGWGLQRHATRLSALRS
jgi:hypothetical protein